ncbi:MAG TPA: hypothetical protein VGM56_03750, partial [Byssovorax sp.]
MRARGWFVVFVAAAVLVASAGRAEAQGSPRDEAQAAFDAAEARAAAYDFGAALEAYRSVVAIDPSAPFARVARARADDLASRSEGNFGPYATVERARRDPGALATADAALELARAAEDFPRGRVRAEARLLAGGALFRRFDDARAEAVLLAAADDPDGDRLTRGLALADAVLILRRAGRAREALALLDAHADLLPNLRGEVARDVRRHDLARAAAALVAAAALLALAGAALGARRVGGLRALPRYLLRPLPVAAALYLGGAGAIVASARSDGEPLPFLVLGVGLVGCT